MRIVPALALLTLIAAADPPPSIDGLPLGPLQPQSLPARGCAAYLFTVGHTRVLAAVAQAEAGELRIALEGKVADFRRVGESQGGAYGFTGETIYRAAAVTATLQMTIVDQPELRQGARISDATLRLDRAGEDTLIVPMGGMIGCAS